MRKTILKLKSITKRYNKPGFSIFPKKNFGIPAIEDISLSLFEGEIIGLIGESGSGKTTMGKSILKLTDIDSGEIELFGNNITVLSERKFRPLRKDIQMIFQDLDAALNPSMKISSILIEIIKRHKKVSDTEAKKKLHQLIQDVHLLPEILSRFPEELSGGQKRRIAIASALAVEPKIIIADEPTTGLDNYTQSLIMKLILDLQAAKNLSMILISHDLQLVKTMCQRIAVMYLGNIIEIGSAEKLSNNPAHPYSALLWQSHVKHTKNNHNENRQHDIRSGLFDFSRPTHGCRFAPRCTQYINMNKPEICIAKDSKPQLNVLKNNDNCEDHNTEHKVACHFPL